MIKNILLVGLGGAVGSILRYLTSIWIDKQFQALFPWAIFLVNITGCLLIGLLIGLSARHQVANPEMRLLLVTGFCGGYTTFSTFASENFNLLQGGHTWTAMFYIAGSVLVGISAVWLGMNIVK